jgi:ribosome-binding protein aMBF1 (putative translation factor)
MQTSLSEGWGNATPTQRDSQQRGWTQKLNGDGNYWTGTDTSLPGWLNDRQDREAFLESVIEQDVAWQVRLNREARDLSQKELADLVGTTQSGVARIEDPTYGKHSLAMLVKIAHAFDCALSVRFVDFQELVSRTKDTSAEALTVNPTNNAK